MPDYQDTPQRDSSRGRLTQRLPLLFALLCLILPLALSPLLLGSDSLLYLRWATALLAFSVLTLPLNLSRKQGSPSFTPDLPGAGWIFGKALGLLLVSFAVWTLSYLEILPFGVPSIVVVFLLLGLLFWGKSRGTFRAASDLPDHSLARIIGYEAAFLMLLLFWTFARGLRPEIDGLEKFMDYGFMMTLDRTQYLPAPDMWFAGSPINYYYYGQYVFTLLSKLSAVAPAAGYNLAIATVFAFTGMLSFSVIRVLASFKPARNLASRILQVGGAALGAVLVTIGGNSHSFFYADDAPGQAILRGLQSLGVNVGTIGGFFFSDSTRFIGHNPNVPDKTIHEFPYYSFLVADLHAHMINLIFVLLFLGLLLVLVRRVLHTDPQATEGTSYRISRLTIPQEPLLRKLIHEPAAWFLTLCMAVFMMCNFWDFIIYLVVLMMVLAFVGVRHYQDLGGWESLPLFALQFLSYLLPFMLISTPILQLLVLGLASLFSVVVHRLEQSPLTLAGASSALVFTAAHVLTLPFNLSFDPIAMDMALVESRSAPFQLGILWGSHILVGLAFLICLTLFARSSNKHQPDRKLPTRKASVVRWFSERDAADIIALLLWLAGLGLILAPELLYVVDIYGGEHKRANTMFKFTYQAFVMLGLAWGWFAYRFLDQGVKRFTQADSPSHSEQAIPGQAGRRTVSLVLGFLVTLLAIVPLWYPLSATSYWLDNWTVSNYRGLDGTVQLAAKNSAQIPDMQTEGPGGDLYHDYQAIQWLNTNVEGHPVILESYGESYTDYNRISAYTGLPTVLGWQTHEWLWRTSATTPDAYGQIVAPRQADVRLMYEGTDMTLVNQLLDEYHVEYIVVGTLERVRFEAINEPLLQSLGQIVFSSGDLYIIQRTPGYSPGFPLS